MSPPWSGTPQARLPGVTTPTGRTGPPSGGGPPWHRATPRLNPYRAGIPLSPCGHPQPFQGTLWLPGLPARPACMSGATEGQICLQTPTARLQMHVGVTHTGTSTWTRVAIRDKQSSYHCSAKFLQQAGGCGPPPGCMARAFLALCTCIAPLEASMPGRGPDPGPGGTLTQPVDTGCAEWAGLGIGGRLRRRGGSRCYRRAGSSTPEGSWLPAPLGPGQRTPQGMPPKRRRRGLRLMQRARCSKRRTRSPA